MSDKQFERVDLRNGGYNSTNDEMKRTTDLCFRVNQCNPLSSECRTLIEELFPGLDPSTRIVPPIRVLLANFMKIGKRVIINFGLTAMSRGGITIDDDVMIAPNVQLLSNNHDLTDRYVLLCSPIHIKRNAWIGAGAIITPGVTIGENAVVAAGAVVTKDVEDNTVVGGNPAKLIKRIEM